MGDKGSGDYLSANAFAKERGVSFSRIRHLLYQGRIEGATRQGPGARWYIPRDARIIPSRTRRPFEKLKGEEDDG